MQFIPQSSQKQFRSLKMIGFYNTIKYTHLLSNFLYLILAIGIMSAAGLGLQIVEPNTPEHTYFVETLVLGATICMIIIFGCYGLVCNLLSVNIIFTCCVLILLGVEYNQVCSYRYESHGCYSGPMHQLEYVWHQYEKEAGAIGHLEEQKQQNCCNFANLEDYRTLHLHIPASCYQELQSGSPYQDTNDCFEVLNSSYRYIQRRDKLFMWSIVGFEILIIIQSIALSILLYKMRTRQRLALQQNHQGQQQEVRANHIVGSRSRF